MSLYLAIPKASHALVRVATGTVIKTVLQVAMPSTTDIRVVAWGISFAGVTAGAAKGDVALIDTDVASTVTTLTPEEWGSDESQSSLCVGGTSATGYNASAEGSIGASRILDGQLIDPQVGYSIWFPLMPRVKPSRFLRIRTTFAVSVDAVPFILWQEPA